MTTQTLPLPIEQTVAPAVQGWPPLLDARLAETSLAPNERLALTEFLAALHTRYGDWLNAVILYGSAARGEVRFAPGATDTFDSDVDLLIVLNREATREEQSAICGLAFELKMRHECDLMALVMTPKTFAWHGGGSSLWLNIQTDGIWLWSSGYVVPEPNHCVIREQFSDSGEYMLTESQYDEIRIYFERADDDLDTARLLLDSWKERQAIGLCYYAAFYAASALLLTQGITRAKHSGIRSALGQYFFKEDILPPHWSKFTKSYKKSVKRQLTKWNTNRARKLPSSGGCGHASLSTRPAATLSAKGI